MTIPWKKGPPPEGEAGSWLVWIGLLGARFARRDVRDRLFVLDPSGGHPPSWLEGRITHHYPHPITPPGEVPTPPSPREGGEGTEAKLRTFALDVMGEWPHECGVDGFQLQDLAVKRGLLKPVTMTAPCGEGCQCAEYYESDELAEGVTCYRKTELLLPGEGA